MDLFLFALFLALMAGLSTSIRSILAFFIKKPSPEIICVPYSRNVSNQVRLNRSKILISHFGLNEGILNSGMSIVSDLSVKDLIGKYELVLLGHYHKPQEIVQDNFSLYYVGSLIQLDWGEKDDEKRFLVVDSDTLSVSSIPISTYKRHIEIELAPPPNWRLA